MRNSNNSLETINAAATAIVNAEGRVQQATVRKRRWGSCWSVYWCFGFQRHGKRISHAALVPGPTIPGTATSVTENSIHTTTIALPFVAPPSSPASFLQSEPPSATQSPSGLLSLIPLSSNAYSPGGPYSIFAIGPYAHETQLVSPPVFSTFPTEPSTAPFTPPPESVHLTTPSSPEVPFAQLLTSSLDHNNRTGGACQKFSPSHYEFQAYHLYPGSPVGHLISPSSAIGSGTTSPFPDRDFTSILEFQTGEPPKLFSIDGFSTRKWAHQQDSGSLMPDATIPTSEKGSQNDEIVIAHRVSFELTAEDVVASCVEKKSAALVEAVSEEEEKETNERDGIPGEADNACGSQTGETSNEMLEKVPENGKEDQRQVENHCSLTQYGSLREFKFDNADGGASATASVWWANEKVARKESDWTFFPRMEPGIS